MLTDTIRIQDIKVHTKWEGKEVKVEVDDEDLRRASLDLQTRLMALIDGKVFSQAIQDMPTDNLFNLFGAFKEEMARRGYYP